MKSFRNLNKVMIILLVFTRVRFMYFDTHCHLNSEQLYEKKDEFIKHALDNQVEMMVVVAMILSLPKRQLK